MPTYVPDRSVPVIVQNRDALEAIAGMAKATGLAVFAANPADGDTVTIYGKTFEFLNDPETLSEDFAVQIETADAAGTRDNLLAALAVLPRVNSDIPLVEAVATTVENDPAISITYWELGTVGNNEIAEDGALVVSGMAGGKDGGTVSVSVTGFEAPDIDIGDVNLLNIAKDRINPAEKGEAAAATALLATETTLQGTNDALDLLAEETTLLAIGENLALLALASTGTINFTVNPADGDLVSVSDGLFLKVFEFDLDPPGVTPGNIAVAIESTPQLTQANLGAAIEWALNITVTCHPTQGCLLVNNTKGAFGDVLITTSVPETIAVTGMAGGQYAVNLQTIDDKLAALPVELDLDILATATIGASDDLATAFNVTLPADLTRLVLVPRGDVFWNLGTEASALTARIPAGGISLPVTVDIAALIEIFADDVVCDLMAFVPRD